MALSPETAELVRRAEAQAQRARERRERAGDVVVVQPTLELEDDSQRVA